MTSENPLMGRVLDLQRELYTNIMKIQEAGLTVHSTMTCTDHIRIEAKIMEEDVAFECVTEESIHNPGGTLQAQINALEYILETMPKT